MAEQQLQIVRLHIDHRHSKVNTAVVTVFVFVFVAAIAAMVTQATIKGVGVAQHQVSRFRAHRRGREGIADLNTAERRKANKKGGREGEGGVERENEMRRFDIPVL